MEARVFGWLWLLLARALLCYGRPDRRIEIRGQVHYNEKTDEIRNATMKIDQCPEYNFRNNFYYAVTCAGFVRVFMDQEWRTKKKWDEKKGSTFIEDWQEDLEQKLKENMHRKCYNNDKFKVFYYKEDHRHSGDGLNYRLIFLRYGEHNSPVRMWITEDLLESRYKYETLFEEFPHPTNWDFMGYANQNGEEGSNYVCDPESSSYDPETEDFHFPHDDDFTGNNVSDVPYTVHENADEIHLPDQYYDDQDAVDAAVQKKAQKPVKVNYPVHKHLARLSMSVLLATIIGFSESAVHLIQTLAVSSTYAVMSVIPALICYSQNCYIYLWRSTEYRKLFL
ncbi:hypothetical protein QR680_014258 [Steinernema hermaphroditum]|uniref:Uncharacterized protein n=1 Tax=Steinernema hermaphroditum TaxID=289476 RepID=A0AA39I9U1_9BILA|nr:hypothetical protein QR680_014258 [Steinernema hermaphroditum]